MDYTDPVNGFGIFHGYFLVLFPTNVLCAACIVNLYHCMD